MRWCLSTCILYSVSFYGCEMELYSNFEITYDGAGKRKGWVGLDLFEKWQYCLSFIFYIQFCMQILIYPASKPLIKVHLFNIKVKNKSKENGKNCNVDGLCLTLVFILMHVSLVYVLRNLKGIIQQGNI